MQSKAITFGICGTNMALGIVFILVLPSYLTKIILLTLLINSATFAATQTQQLTASLHTLLSPLITFFKNLIYI